MGQDMAPVNVDVIGQAARANGDEDDAAGSREADDRKAAGRTFA
jgi:hypothetical protein